MSVERPGEAIGGRMRRLRQERGYDSVAALARAADVDDNWLYRVELGYTESPSSLLLLKVARALGVSMEYLLTGEEGET